MSRYAPLANPKPVWSIFDYAAALFVEPVLEGVSMLGSYRSARRKVTDRPNALGVMPRRPIPRYTMWKRFDY